ncbi:MAG TPA: phosphoribosyltransferase [Bdellovibrionota bacterium]|nr:phosphoribosyltransferase [Bdellovibrionota bacterium]
MMFKDRCDAGCRLAQSLKKYKNHKNCVVIGLPRGGIPVAYEVAQALNLPLDLIVIKKLGAPHQTELAMGAVDETGHTTMNLDIVSELAMSRDHIERIKKEGHKKAKTLYQLLRGGVPPLNLKNKIAIIVDDGLATGATMDEAIHSAKSKGAQKIIVAVPVASSSAFARIKNKVDEMVCLNIPSSFGAVGNFYESFDQTSDEMCIDFLQRQHKKKAS